MPETEEHYGWGDVFLPSQVRAEYERNIEHGFNAQVRRALDKGGPEELAVYAFSLEALCDFEDHNEDNINPDFVLGSLLERDLKDLFLSPTTNYTPTYEGEESE